MLKVDECRSSDRNKELFQIVNSAIENYAGNIDELQKALGLLFIGDAVGWKALVVWHNKRSIRKYEEILGIKIRDFFPEVGVISSRSVGLQAAIDSGQFWKVVSGDISVENRRQIIQ